MNKPIWTEERAEIATWLSGYLAMVKQWVDKILDNEHYDVDKNKIINFQDYNAQTIGIILLWLSAALTLFTGYEYMRKGIDHAISEDNK